MKAFRFIQGPTNFWNPW